MYLLHISIIFIILLYKLTHNQIFYMKKIYISILFVVALFNPNSSKAQSPVYKEATLTHSAELWKPFKLDESGNNVLNGVHLYSHNSDCNSVMVKLIKLVNVNTYPVRFDYQLSETSPVVSVIVPASVSIEGSCSSLDNEIKKLVVVVPTTKTEETKKNKEFMRQHITVVPFK